MLRNVLTLLFIASALLFAAPAWSYDAVAAQGYEAMFATAHGAKVGKELHLLPPDKFIEKTKKGETLVVLDIRTPAERSVIGMTYKDTLNISLNDLFKKENLSRLPTDRPIVVVCQSGIRGTAAATALRHVGFKNAFILKGGMKGLISSFGPKEANTPLAKKK